MRNKIYFKLLLVILGLMVGLMAGCGDESTSLPKGITASAIVTVESETAGSLAVETPNLPLTTLPPTVTLSPTATPQPSNTPQAAPTLPATPTVIPETTPALVSPTPFTASPVSAKITVTASATLTKPATTGTKNISDESSPCAVGQIKGNRNSKIYHTPGQRDYAKTKSNVQCFDTEAEAQAAGYRHALR